MAIFVFNEGYGHRGVWHISNSGVTSVDVEAREHKYDYEVMKYKDPYDRNPEPTGQMHYTISRWPAYVNRHIKTVYCNQVSKLRSGDGFVDRHDRDWNKPGTFIYEYEVKRGNFIYEADEPPPGPFCSRCLKKWKEDVV